MFNAFPLAQIWLSNKWFQKILLITLIRHIRKLWHKTWNFWWDSRTLDPEHITVVGLRLRKCDPKDEIGNREPETLLKVESKNWYLGQWRWNWGPKTPCTCRRLDLRPRTFIRTIRKNPQHESSVEDPETQDLGLQKISYVSTQDSSSKVYEICAKIET